MHPPYRSGFCLDVNPQSKIDAPSLPVGFLPVCGTAFKSTRVVFENAHQNLAESIFGYRSRAARTHELTLATLSPDPVDTGHNYAFNSAIR